MMCVVSTYPKRDETYIIAHTIRAGTNDKLICDRLKSQLLFQQILGAIASTELTSDILSDLLNAVSNACTVDETNCAEMVKANALQLLQPAVQNLKGTVALDAAFTICSLTSLTKDSELVPRKLLESCLAMVEDKVRTMIPGDYPDMNDWTESDVKALVTLLASPDKATQLTVLHTICNSLHDGATEESREELMKPEVTAAVRVCAQSSDGFVYMAWCVFPVVTHFT